MLCMFIMMILVIIFLFCKSNFGNAIQCLDAYSCAGDFLQTNTLSYELYIECLGYFSCYNATLIDLTGAGNIYCDGSYSCYKSNKIFRDESSVSGRIECRGLYSCAFVQNGIQTNNTQIYCYGEKS